MTFRLSAFALLLLALPSLAQKSPDEALKSMTPADGLQVELFAAEPMVLNPTSMDTDPKGRVWVTEAVNYRRKNFNRPILREAGDRIQVLIDTNGDGKADEAKTFYQGVDLYGPLGICIAPYHLASGGRQSPEFGYRVFVCQSPDILVFEDKDGDLKADGPPSKFLTGFNGFDHDHGVHGINIGPDGKLYFTVGDAGVKNLQAADGKGLKWTSNTTDCQKGTVWRCDMDGKNLELIAHNFRNNYECCVNSFGEVWLSDNDDDGNQQTRICFVMPGGNYGYGPRGKGESHWHEEQPGIVHKTLRTGFGSPTGITFYEGSLLPEKYRGQLLHTDAGPRELRCFHIKPKGAGYELDKTVMLTSPDNWFRPSDVCVAPDGSVFVADWYDPGVGGHGMGDWTRGRVYRVTPKGHVGYKVPEVNLDSGKGIFDALSSPCLSTRAQVLELIRTITKEDTKKIGSGDVDPEKMPELFKARVFQMRHLIPFFERAGLMNGDPLPFDAPPDALTLTRLRVIRDNFDRVPEAALSEWKTMLKTKGDMFATLRNYSPALARELLILLRLLSDLELVKPSFYSLAKAYDGQDHFYRAALNIACGTDPARRDAILADFPKHFPEWNDRVADLVWELRPKSMLPKLDALLADAKLTGAQKARIVDILAASDDASAGASMLKLLTSDAAPEVKQRALENLRIFLPTKWNKLASGDDFRKAVAALLAEPKTQVTGLQVAAAAALTTVTPKVCMIATDDATPAEVRLEAVRTLGKLPGNMALHPLRQLLGDKSLASEAVRSLAAHIGTGQKASPLGQTAMTYIQEVILADDTSADLKALAVDALAGTRAGTDWLLDLQEQKKLPEPLVGLAGKLLRNSPFQGQRNRALILFPAAAKIDPKKLIPAELAKRAAGNVAAGKKVMAASLAGNAQCLKCHTIRGIGGQVGPDLSMIGKKGSRENLFESLVQPSKAIADQYIQQTIDNAGVPVTGLVVAETKQAVTLRDANGKDTVIKVADIDSRKPVKVSIMPDDIIASLTEEELIDLVAYLETLKTAALTPESWKVAGPFASPGGNMGLEKAYLDEKAAIDGKPIRANAAGYFDLAAFHGSKGDFSVSYAYTEVESPIAQEAEILLGTDDGAKLFINGEQVFETQNTKAAAPGQHTVKAKLKAGKNVILLKVANGKNPHGFYFTMLTEQELKGSK